MNSPKSDLPEGKALSEERSLHSLDSNDGVLAAVSQEVAKLAAQVAKDPDSKAHVSDRLKQMSADNAFGAKI